MCVILHEATFYLLVMRHPSFLYEAVVAVSFKALAVAK